MFKNFILYASFVSSIVATSAFSQDAMPDDARDPLSFVTRQIAQGAPTETSCLESIVLGAISLDAYGDRLAGGSFRAREVVLQPGAKIAIHAHDQRPAMVYVIDGEALEHRNDSDEPLTRRAGDSYFEGPGVAHWLENVSSKPVRVFSVDIVPREAE